MSEARRTGPHAFMLCVHYHEPALCALCHGQRDDERHSAVRTPEGWCPYCNAWHTPAECEVAPALPEERTP